jgi:hypothetical protein
MTEIENMEIENKNRISLLQARCTHDIKGSQCLKCGFKIRKQRVRKTCGKKN